MENELKNRPSGELTDEKYWSALWEANGPPKSAINPTQNIYQDYHKFYGVALAGRTGRVLEVGCGASLWLPYFAHYFQLDVAGIDYSAVGCRYAVANLDGQGVRGQILERDAFAENQDLLEQFDIVVSSGVIEHFADTEAALRCFARYVKPGGLLISTCPNLSGVVGAVQRCLNREVYDGHIPLTLAQVSSACSNLGLEVQQAAYLGGLDFHALNMHGMTATWKKLLYRVLLRLTRLTWAAKLPIPRARIWSSSLGVSARKPQRS